MSRRQKSSKVVAIFVAVASILLVTAAGRALVSFAIKHGVHFEREHLKARTIAISELLDMESIRNLTGLPADERKPAFLELVAQLKDYRKAHDDVRFIYLMGWKSNQVIFLLDSTDPSSFDYSPPGEVYGEASPELVRSFTTGVPFTEGPLSDRWGTWVSGLVPIYDPSRNGVLAVLGMDINATRWRISVQISRVIAYLFTGLLAWIVVSLTKRFYRRFAPSQPVDTDAAVSSIPGRRRRHDRDSRIPGPGRR